MGLYALVYPAHSLRGISFGAASHVEPQRITVATMSNVAALLPSPFTIATCITRPTVVFTNASILTTIVNAVVGLGVAAVLALAMAAYLSLYPILLLPPMVLFAYGCFPRSGRDARPN